MKVLVTGGAGFIGSHVADALVARGYDVHVMDDLSGGRRANVPDTATFHELDIRSAGAADLIRKEKFDALLHLAAQMDVRKSVADPRFDADVNVIGALNLLEAGRESELKKVVFASTGGAIYGEPDPAVNDAGPQPEHHPQRPLSPYGITKLALEKYLYFYEQTHGIPYVALRFGNVYGPRQNPHGEAGVVAIFAERLLDGQQPVIYGHGEQTRDYVYVGDVVRAILAGLDHEGSEIVNVGTGQETSVNRLFHVINDLTGGHADEVHADAKPGEQQRSVLDVSHAADVFGWQPQVELETGLSRTVDWFAQRRAMSDE
ncbi:MAG: NAD-dependent epimerase/dehydratase family protein [Rhodothermales bacterium]